MIYIVDYVKRFSSFRDSSRALSPEGLSRLGWRGVKNGRRFSQIVRLLLMERLCQPADDDKQMTLLLISLSISVNFMLNAAIPIKFLHAFLK